MRKAERVYEALEEGRRAGKVRKAKKLKEDIDRLHNPPEALKQDVAELVGSKNYELAKRKLERL